ncbi:MAG: epimerase [Actinomycetia bacterium]|nr:epimerase [Actinomycetes bacterium]
MKLLVLGGTGFVSRRIAAEALARGHDVVCAARGVHGAPPAGASFVAWDRVDPVPDGLVAMRPDGVVDVSGTPAHVSRAVAAFPGAHWVFISTLNVYVDESRPGASADDSALVAPQADGDPRADPAAYGPMKVACEEAVRAGAEASLVLRPGLIVGPDDPSGRFAYWPHHAALAAADGAGLLVPGTPDDPVQFIDVGDLAAWVVRALETRVSGCLDAIGPSLTRRAFVDGLVAGVGGGAEPVYVPSGVLVDHGGAEWSGPRSIPLWVADPAASGFMAREVSASLRAGLAVRPLADTVRETLAWLRSTPDAPITGLTRDEERRLLDDWRHRTAART